jgi:hypothetical protein
MKISCWNTIIYQISCNITYNLLDAIDIGKVDDDTKLYGKGIHREAKNGRSKDKSRMVNIVIKYQKKIFSGRWLASHVLGLLQYLLLKLIHLIYRTIPTRRSQSCHK